MRSAPLKPVNGEWRYTAAHKDYHQPEVAATPALCYLLFAARYSLSAGVQKLDRRRRDRAPDWTPITPRVFTGEVGDIDLRLLRVFMAVADHGGFAAAEVALGKNKSAISMDIANLEARLGTRLCQRGRSGFSLTEEGQAIYLATLQLFADIGGFRDKVATATRKVIGRVTLVMVDNIVSVAEQPLAQALARFCKGYPDVDLALASAPSSVAERQVLEGSADLGISVLPRAMAALKSIPLFSEEARLYCGRDHPLFEASIGRVTEKQLAEYRIVGPSASDDPGFALSRAAWLSGVSAEALDARVLLALCGAMLAFLPPHYARRWVEEGRLRPIGGEAFTTTNIFHMFFKKAAQLGAAASHLRRIILDAFEADGPV
jgi:LysR family transcriptional regulator, transcriptional activator for bauABCD operon